MEFIKLLLFPISANQEPTYERSVVKRKYKNLKVFSTGIVDVDAMGWKVVDPATFVYPEKTQMKIIFDHEGMEIETSEGKIVCEKEQTIETDKFTVLSLGSVIDIEIVKN
jgi:hypothetical protein